MLWWPLLELPEHSRLLLPIRKLLLDPSDVLRWVLLHLQPHPAVSLNYNKLLMAHIFVVLVVVKHSVSLTATDFQTRPMQVDTVIWGLENSYGRYISWYQVHINSSECGYQILVIKTCNAGRISNIWTNFTLNISALNSKHSLVIK